MVMMIGLVNSHHVLSVKEKNRNNFDQIIVWDILRGCKEKQK